MAVVALLGPSLPVLLAALHALPWQPRKPSAKPPRSHELMNPEHWPAEPPSPAIVDVAKFREAFAYACGRSVSAVPADDLLAAATEAGVDPFLLAGLAVERSGCDPRRKTKSGFGMLVIHPALYASPGAPPLPVTRAELAPRALLDARHNLMIGAKLLRMWQDAHAELDETFGGVPHRSGVAHFQWGDQVKGSGGEDMAFTARRRMLCRYEPLPEVPIATSIGVLMVSPLEGVPRVATSGPGEDREGGLRRHRGVDIAASQGEPVRSLADGEVIFAGVNLRGAPRRGPIPPSKVARYRYRRLGAGGIYLCIKHDVVADAPQREVVSCYMHLSRYLVAQKERVTAGQTIGFVGRSGVRLSPPHLHLELRVNDYAKNPLRYLTNLVIPPKATRAYRFMVQSKRARLKAERAAARTGG